MVLMMMMMMVMMVSVEGQNVMKVRAELGKDVSLNCSITTKDIFWFVQLYSQISAGIGRVYYPDVSLYFTPDYESKYLLLKNRLVIKNFTADDCRSYFCAEMKNHYYIFVDSFLLDSDVSNNQTPSSTSIYNQKNTSETLRTELLQKKEVVFSSLGLNGLLLLIIIGLMFLLLRKRRERSDTPKPHKNQEAYYEEVNLPLPREQAIYHKVQLPY
ncbi:hypothetical protein FQA47_022191 [Oryzias melastigma]|uniref:Immunoglobulin subtype domain-containing protein n=1 Tax=Oryzias melastigma TaxID=30732 RepID=A0A834L0B9_ORYME|nr:hypothetical protein FQA47_022191 [Oryzias melastigma]